MGEFKPDRMINEIALSLRLKKGCRATAPPSSSGQAQRAAIPRRQLSIHHGMPAVNAQGSNQQSAHIKALTEPTLDKNEPNNGVTLIELQALLAKRRTQVGIVML